MMDLRPALAASVIVPCKNESKNVGRCLEAVLGQASPGTFEVIVIDSGSTDGTVEIVRQFDVRLHQIPPDEFGHGRTRNLGASLATGRHLVFLNADAIPVHTGWLQQLIVELEPGDVAGVYGRQVARPGAYPMERFFLDYLYGERRSVQTKTNRSLDMSTILFSTVNCAVKRSIWERYPFSETIVMTEDQAWSRRVLEAGYTIIYSPEAAVSHSHNYSLQQAFRRFFDSGWSSEDSYLPDSHGATATLLRRSLGYSLREIGFMLRRGYWRWLPYAGLYEGSKFAGLLLGRWHRWFPDSLKRRLSANYRGAISSSSR
jgi:rhamnosyltransferase